MPDAEIGWQAVNKFTIFGTVSSMGRAKNAVTDERPSKSYNGFEAAGHADHQLEKPFRTETRIEGCLSCPKWKRSRAE